MDVLLQTPPSPFLLFPLSAVGTFWFVKSRLPEISRRKVIEEMAWTDHAAAMEEGIAARDDLRTSLGQAYVVRRCTELAATLQENAAGRTVLSMPYARADLTSLEEAGTEQETGAHLYRTTAYFLERIGITSLDELPELAPFLPEMDQFDEPDETPAPRPDHDAVRDSAVSPAGPAAG